MKSSKQRELILDIVKSNNIHPTAEWVYGEAKRIMPQIGVATVYRNLNQLVEQGSLNKIVIPGEPDRFDGQMTEHYHMKSKDGEPVVDLFPKSEAGMKNLKAAFEEAFGIENLEFVVDGTLLTGVRMK